MAVKGKQFTVFVCLACQSTCSTMWKVSSLKCMAAKNVSTGGTVGFSVYCSNSIWCSMRKLSRIDYKKTLDKVDSSVENERLQRACRAKKNCQLGSQADLKEALVPKWFCGFSPLSCLGYLNCGVSNYALSAIKYTRQLPSQNSLLWI